MAHQQLNRAQVGAGFEQVRRIAVSQRGWIFFSSPARVAAARQACQTVLSEMGYTTLSPPRQRLRSNRLLGKVKPNCLKSGRLSFAQTVT
jgi:hypothetical protein